jgi:hypothetical protein
MVVHPKTISRALKRGEAPSRKRKRRGSKLDPYKEKIDQLLSEGLWNAVVSLREIEAAATMARAPFCGTTLPQADTESRPGHGALRDKARPPAAKRLGRIDDDNGR